MSPVGSGSPMLGGGAEQEWADIQARWVSSAWVDSV